MVRLLLLHGLASTCAEFSLIRRPLAAQGIAVECLSVPGYTHGTPVAACAPAWVDGFATQCRQWRDCDPDAVLVVGGLCVGAMVAAAAVIREPALADALVMMSPAFRYDGWGLPWWYRARHAVYLCGAARRFRMHEREPFGLKDERVRAWVRGQMHGTGSSAAGPASVSLDVVQAAERLTRHVRRALPRWAGPLQVIHAGQDEICRVSTVRATLAALPVHGVEFGGDAPTATATRLPAAERLRRFDVLDDCYHMITVDRRRAQVAGLAAAFAHDVAARRASRILQASHPRLR